MRNSLLAPLYFLGSCLILLALTLVFLWLDAAAILGQAQGGLFSVSILRQVLTSIPPFLPMVAALGLFFAFIRLRKRPGIRPLTYLFLWVFVFGFLMLGTLKLSPLSTRRPAEGPSAILWHSEGIQYLPLEGGTWPIFVEEGEGEKLKEIIVPWGEKDFQLLHYPRGRVTATEVVLEGSPRGLALPLSQEHPFGNPGKLNSHLESLKELGIGLTSQGSTKNVAIAVAALSFYLVSCWGFIRISRWNLLNIFLLLFLIRLSALIYQVFSSDLAIEVAKLLSIPFSINRLPFSALGIAGLSLLLIDCLFIPYNRRIQEETDG